MPELPEVEHIRRGLSPRVEGRSIAGVEFLSPPQWVVRYPDPDSFRSALTGSTVRRLLRRGKYLLFRLDGGRTLLLHLRMTGRLLLGEEPPVSHTHLRFLLEDGTVLRYADVRRFGGFWFLHGQRGAPEGFLHLGPEPLGPAFTPEYLQKACAGRRAPVKAILLNQEIVAGIGNIYSDEALFRAGIRPDRPALSLSSEEAVRLTAACRQVLRESIRQGGTTFRDYLGAGGERGEFGQRLAVYGREGLPCLRCGTPIPRQKIGGRSSFYCPSCQQ